MVFIVEFWNGVVWLWLQVGVGYLMFSCCVKYWQFFVVNKIVYQGGQKYCFFSMGKFCYVEVKVWDSEVGCGIG